ncbi:hypothetical protein VKT23_017355 [Stygiomarasmius scandens]|uniref:NAD(P)-binding domain-containing protein n=1 Tax=Marasmiellus scandens TaxID=2682957 RepID=A0ABR1IVG3_9AGAR
MISCRSQVPADLPPKLASHDACIWALGTSSLGKTEEEYTRITYDYAVSIVSALGEVERAREGKEPFKFVLISGNGADQEEKSSVMFARVKGRTEKYLLDLPPESKIQAYALRPSGFAPEDPIIMKNTRSTTQRLLLGLFMPVFATLIPSRFIRVGDLSRFALETAKGRWGDEKVFDNVRMKKMVAGIN